MNQLDEQMLTAMLEPIAEITKQTYIKAMILRIDVFKCLAVDNGAELEDIPDVVAQAIASAQPIVQKFLDELGEIDRAQKLGERK